MTVSIARRTGLKPESGLNTIGPAKDDIDVDYVDAGDEQGDIEPNRSYYETNGKGRHTGSRRPTLSDIDSDPEQAAEQVSSIASVPPVPAVCSGAWPWIWKREPHSDNERVVHDDPNRSRA